MNPSFSSLVSLYFSSEYLSNWSLLNLQCFTHQLLSVSSHTYFLWLSPDFTVIFPKVSWGPLLFLPQGMMVLTVFHMFAHTGFPSHVKRIIIRSPISVSRVMRKVKVLLPEISSTLKNMGENLKAIWKHFIFGFSMINKHHFLCIRLCERNCVHALVPDAILVHRMSPCSFLLSVSCPQHTCTVFHPFVRDELFRWVLSVCYDDSKLSASPWSEARYFELLQHRTWNINDLLHPRCCHAVFH